MLKEKNVKIGKLDETDETIDSDLINAVADLYSVEKHIILTLNDLSEKIKENPEKEDILLFDLISKLLNEVRSHRAKHMKYIAKLKKRSVWCYYKHFIGAGMQFGEVAMKEIYRGNKERALECLETSNFCFNTIIFLNTIAKKLNKVVNEDGDNTEEKRPKIQLQKRKHRGS